MNNIKIGDTILVTCNDWFYAPDGSSYKAVFGTLKGIHTSEETLGIKTNARSTNWYAEVGDTTIAGCQIHYVVKTDKCNFGPAPAWDTANGNIVTFERPSSIYNANANEATQDSAKPDIMVQYELQTGEGVYITCSDTGLASDLVNTLKYLHLDPHVRNIRCSVVR